MDSSSKDDDLLRLHALLDGELAPAERAEIAGRIAADRDLANAHATFAQLKAKLSEIAADTPAIALPARRRKPIWPIAAAAACLVAIVGLGLFAASRQMPEQSAAALATADLNAP